MRKQPGTPDPVLDERGHKALDLSSIADQIKAMPETDPDKDPPEQVVEQVDPRTGGAPVPPAPSIPKKPPKVKASPERPKPQPQVATAIPPQKGLTGVVSFLAAMRTVSGQMDATVDRINRRKKRFRLELFVRVLLGSPINAKTVQTAYSDAVDATKM
jgi:hypothetical protein